MLGAEGGGGRGGNVNIRGISFFDSSTISLVIEMLNLQMKPGSQYDAVIFSDLCLDLARGIDHAIKNNKVFARVPRLAITLKEICKRWIDDDLLNAIMVLMYSVKYACLLGWFSFKDSEEFFALSNEMTRSFSRVPYISAINSHPSSILSDIMTKFFPLLKLGLILASLEVKQPGYEALVHDFSIPRKIEHSVHAKIMLFVAQTNIAQTSACIISPQQVNFLLNGSGVDKRTIITMDSGPQMPTDVSEMLRRGTNILQAVGQFNGHYLIVVALMSVTSSPDATALLDHVLPDVSENDSDLDVIEGRSRISLNCPLSLTRIKTPVKGRSCKHLQCYDFHNFVYMNSRRPTWRCPHCNQSVNYSDIRIDQNIFKILREVGDNVSEVIISAQGWRAVLEEDDNMNNILIS